MRKVLAGILIFDVVMGILCLVVGTRQYAGDRQLNTREGKIQELAKQLGVDAEGTKKEIATRCAAVEVDIPDESELTEEDKRAAEEAAAEAAAKAEEEEAATELVKVKAQRRFLDKELNQIKDTGDEYAVSRERAAVLEEAGVAAVIEE